LRGYDARGVPFEPEMPIFSTTAFIDQVRDQNPTTRSGDAKPKVPNHSSPGHCASEKQRDEGHIASPDGEDELRPLDLTANPEG
jgi:hypothetical protein